MEATSLNRGCDVQMVEDARCENPEASPQALKEKAEEIDLLASVDECVDRVLEEA